MADNENGELQPEEKKKFEYSTRKKVEVENSEPATLKQLSMSLGKDETSDIVIKKPGKTSKYVISIRPQSNHFAEPVSTSAYKCQVCSRTSVRLYVLAHHLRSHFRYDAAEIKPTKRKNKPKASLTKKSIKISNAIFAKHLAKPTTTSTKKVIRKETGPTKRKNNEETKLKEKITPKQTEKIDENKMVSNEAEAKQTSTKETDAKSKVAKRSSKEIDSKRASPALKPKVAKRSDMETPTKQTSLKETQTVAKRSYKKKKPPSEIETPRANTKKTPSKNAENIKIKEKSVSADFASEINDPAKNSAKKRGRPPGKKSTGENAATASSEKKRKINAVKATAFKPDEIHNIILLDFEKSNENEANVSNEEEKSLDKSISAYDASEWDETISGDEETDEGCSFDQAKSISEESGFDMELQSSSVGNDLSSSNAVEKSVSEEEITETSPERESPEEISNEINPTAEDSAINGSDFSNIADIQLDSDDDEINSNAIESNKLGKTENDKRMEISKSECASDDLSDIIPEKCNDSNGKNMIRAESPTGVVANGTQYDENDKIIRDIADMDIEDEFAIPQMGNILDSLANGFSADENSLTHSLIALSDKSSNGEPMKQIKLNDQTEFIRQNSALKPVGKDDDLILDVKILNQVSLLKSRSKQRGTDEKVSDSEEVITIEDSD